MQKNSPNSKITVTELIDLFNQKMETSGNLEWADYTADGTVFQDDEGEEWVIRIEKNGT